MTDFEIIQDARNAVTKAKLWDWLATYEPEKDKGFMFSDHPNLRLIEAEMTYKGHSGASFATVMRVMQSMAKPTACPCRLQRGERHGWCGVAGGGVPACDH